MSGGHHTKQWLHPPPQTGSYHPSAQAPLVKMEDERNNPYALGQLQPQAREEAFFFTSLQPYHHGQPLLPPTPLHEPQPPAHGQAYPFIPEMSLPYHHGLPHPPPPREEQKAPRPLHSLQQPPQPLQLSGSQGNGTSTDLPSANPSPTDLPSVNFPPRKLTKRHRAVVACDSCRGLKVKCDEQKPCKNCSDKILECIYRVTSPPTPTDTDQMCKTLENLQEAMELMNQKLEKLAQEVTRLTLQNAADRAARETEPPGDVMVRSHDKMSADTLLSSWPTIFSRVEEVSKAGYPITLPLINPKQHELGRVNIRWHECPNSTPFQPNSHFNLHLEKVWDYVTSYKAYMQNMYPLIPPNKLHAMVTNVLQAATAASVTKTDWVRGQEASPMRPPSQSTEMGLKRKRESENSNSGSASAAPSEARLDQPYCSIESAVVLMVLALGQICISRPLCSPAARGTSATETRAVDENIGQCYFEEAFHIFRALGGAYEVEHVWFYILGSLCYDQLGRPVQSQELLSAAGLCLQDIIGPNLQRYQKLRTDVQKGRDDREMATRVADNEILVAAWTCLLQERLLLAELPLPPSKMLPLETWLPYPDGEAWAAQGFSSHVLEAFCAQIHIHGLVNDIYKCLYGDNRQGQANHPLIQACIDTLQTLGSPNAAFQQGPLISRDQPATDILTARLRAAYWRAEVVVYRSFIQRILAFNFEKRARQDVAVRDSADAPDDRMPLEELAKMVQVVNAYTVKLARRGIEALIQNTRAFHDLPFHKFVINNVYGTMHAHWGNLLILDSVQRDPDLGKYVDNDEINRLFVVTIAFLEQVAESNSSLKQDLEILKGLYQLRRNRLT